MISPDSCPSFSTEISDSFYLAFLKGLVIYVYEWDYQKKYDDERMFLFYILRISRSFRKTEFFFIISCNFL